MKLQCLFMGALLLSFCGCGGEANDGPKRRIVEGEVSYKGAPLEHGMIRFVPQPDGPVLTAAIEKGHYRADNKGGVPLGQVRVEITASQNTSNMTEDQILSGAPAAALTIPEKYNTSSQLSETITGGRESQKLNFELTDK